MEIFTGFSLIWHCRKKQYVGVHQLKLNIDLHSYILHSGVYIWLSWEAPIIGTHYLLFTICGLKERGDSISYQPTHNLFYNLNLSIFPLAHLCCPQPPPRSWPGRRRGAACWYSSAPGGRTCALCRLRSRVLSDVSRYTETGPTLLLALGWFVDWSHH